MADNRRPRWYLGPIVGALFGLLVKDLDLTTLVSFFGDRTLVIAAAVLIGSVAWLTRIRRVLAAFTAVVALLWILVALTPLTPTLAENLVRRDEPASGDAIFVLASGIQSDGELTTASMSRLLHGLELLGEGRAPRLILTELPDPYPKYRDAACELMGRLGLAHEVIAVGPVRNTHDEAVAVSEVVRDFGIETLVVVTSPSHSRRASAALEMQGVRVISSPAKETQFDYEGLRLANGDERIRSFGSLLHEYAGLYYYRLRGWIL